MLMINNEEFLTPKNKRCGTQKDAERLRKVFRRYGFEVIEQNDLSSKLMIAVVKAFVRKDSFHLETEGEAKKDSEDKEKMSPAVERFLEQFELDERKLKYFQSRQTINSKHFKELYKFTKEELYEFDNKFKDLGMKAYAREFERNECWVKQVANNFSNLSKWYFLSKHNLQEIKKILKEEEEVKTQMMDDALRKHILEGETSVDDVDEKNTIIKNPYVLPTLEEMLEMDFTENTGVQDNEEDTDSQQKEDKLIEKLLTRMIWSTQPPVTTEEDDGVDDFIEEALIEEDWTDKPILDRKSTDQLRGSFVSEPDTRRDRDTFIEEAGTDGSSGFTYPHTTESTATAEPTVTVEPTATAEPTPTAKPTPTAEPTTMSQEDSLITKAKRFKKKLILKILQKLKPIGFQENVLPSIGENYRKCKSKEDKEQFQENYRLSTKEMETLETSFAESDKYWELLKLHDDEKKEFEKAWRDQFHDLGIQEFIQRYKLSFEDMTKLKKIIKDLLQYKKKPLKETGCLVVVIMSHGKNGKVLGVDEMPVDLDTLCTEFSRDNCPDLIGKPKMFLIQACRGDQYDFHQDNKAKSNKGKRGKEVQEEVWLPYLADTITGYSSSPGYVSYRAPSDGSKFIKNVCAVLDKYWEYMDVLSMTTEINSRVADEHVDKTHEGQLKKTGQMPEFVHSLRKRWMLPKKPDTT